MPIDCTYLLFGCDDSGQSILCCSHNLHWSPVALPCFILHSCGPSLTCSHSPAWPWKPGLSRGPPSLSFFRRESAQFLPEALVLEASLHWGSLEHGKTVDMASSVFWAWPCPPTGSRKHFYPVHKDSAWAPLLHVQTCQSWVCGSWQ